MAETGSFSERQTQFIDALLAHPTVRKAAEVCQLPERTAYRWMKSPSLQARYREALKELHQQNMDTLIKAEVLAVNCLMRNLTAKSELVQVTAAGKIIDMCMERHKQQELEAKLNEMGAIVDARQDRWRA